ncbi:MAG: tubulin-like doman-containing protein, partial [Gemmataceae bacterium]|nr:tubulin-like doman-containing protein [Gemmataceae bacterium]
IGNPPRSGVRAPGSWAKGARTLADVELTHSGESRFTPVGLAGLQTPSRAAQPEPHPEIDDDHLLGDVAPRKDLGVLRPTVLVGVGSFGRRALQEIRCRLTDRVGDVGQVPCFRFLYVDCDPDAAAKAVSAPPDVALAVDEVFPVPLQPVTQYRRRQLEQILDWLPREKLYSIPRNLHAGGSRALGRLAFCDNYLRFVTRLRREFQIATHPESLSHSADQSGLAIRDNTPQVYVFASASGGSGGMLLDLGYAVRRVLARVTPAETPVTAFIYAGSPADPNTPDRELANLYAAVTELNHYADPEVSFAASYGGPEGPKVEGRGLPFSATYLLPMPERSGSAFRDCVAHLAGYVSHDLTTPLGQVLEQLRARPVGFDRSPFRSFGTYGVWFPRGLLLRSAAQTICRRLLREWKADAVPADPAAVNELVAVATADKRLKAEAVRAQLEQEAVRGAEGGPADLVERWLGGLDAQLTAATRRPDAGAWARAVWEQARDLIGTRPAGEQDVTVRRSKVSKLFDEAIRRLAEMWGNEFAEVVRPLESLPGRRLGAIGTAYAKLAEACAGWAKAADARVQQLDAKVRQAKSDVQAAHEVCLAGSGSFSFFGGRSGRSMRHFLDQVRAFAELRLQEELADATAKFYRALRGQIDVRLGELASCRSRLDVLVSAMESPLANLPVSSDTPVAMSEEALQQTLHPTNTLNVVLPAGETRLERSAKKVVGSVGPDDLRRLEVILQKLVLEPRGGLSALCLLNADMSRTLVAPMVEQTTAFLSDLLPVTDVADVEVSTARAKKLDLPARIREYHARSVPPCGGETGAHTFVLVPETESGQAFAAVVRKAVPTARTLSVNGTATDLMFCREHANLSPGEVAGLLSACQSAYYEAVVTAQTSPHARFDVTEWLPLAE